MNVNCKWKIKKIYTYYFHIIIKFTFLFLGNYKLFLLYFFNIYWLCYYSCPISLPSLHSILPTSSLPHSPPIVHVHGSYLQVLWLLHFLHYSYPPPVYFPPIIYATHSLDLYPPLPLPLPYWQPSCDLHLYGSVPVLVVCLVCSRFCFRCGR